MTNSESYKSLPTESHPQQWLRDKFAARWIAILNHKRDSRGLTLTQWQTRAIRKGDIHEVLTTPETVDSTHGQVNRVYYLGFAEFDAGIIAVGDEIWTEDGFSLGQVAGFDETHAPNHMNILLFSSCCQSGVQRGLQPNERLFVCKQGHTVSQESRVEQRKDYF